jgi:hypothetical protein
VVHFKVAASSFFLDCLTLKGATILRTLETTHSATQHHIPEDLNPHFSGFYIWTEVGQREFNRCSTGIETHLKMWKCVKEKIKGGVRKMQGAEGGWS